MQKFSISKIAAASVILAVNIYKLREVLECKAWKEGNYKFTENDFFTKAKGPK